MERHVVAAPIAACCALLVAAGPAIAHHSFAAQFDDDKGKTVNWAVEGGAPNVLYREGWRPDSLKVGDKVTISASRAKDGSNTANATLFMMPDGRCLFAGTSGPGGSATSNCTVGRR
jgi:hypothetical protein